MTIRREIQWSRWRSAREVVLLPVTALDLAGGARADSTHGLAAVYLGSYDAVA